VLWAGSKYRGAAGRERPVWRDPGKGRSAEAVLMMYRERSERFHSERGPRPRLGGRFCTKFLRVGVPTGREAAEDTPRSKNLD